MYALVKLRKKNERPVLKEVTSCKNVNLDQIRSDFESTPWDICSVFEEVDDIAWAWELLYKDIMNNHLKRRKAKIRSNSLPWMNTLIRKSMNNRYKLLQKAQKSNDLNDWKEYKKARNHTTSLCRETERNYWRTKLENAKSSKDFWNTVNIFQGKTKNAKVGPIRVDDESVISTKKDIAEDLNNLFSNVGKNLAKDVEKVDHFTELEHFHRVTPTVEEVNVNTDIVKKTIQRRIKPGKSSGQDMITSNELSIVGDFAAEGLAIVMKKSLEKAQFPNNWKIACVKALHKKGSYLERGNNRPISLLNLPGKLLEAVVGDVIDNHLLHNIRMDKKEQWAFMKGGSPELLMLHLTEIWKEALDKG